MSAVTVQPTVTLCLICMQCKGYRQKYSETCWRTTSEHVKLMYSCHVWSFLHRTKYHRYWNWSIKCYKSCLHIQICSFAWLTVQNSKMLRWHFFLRLWPAQKKLYKTYRCRYFVVTGELMSWSTESYNTVCPRLTRSRIMCCCLRSDSFIINPLFLC